MFTSRVLAVFIIDLLTEIISALSSASWPQSWNSCSLIISFHPCMSKTHALMLIRHRYSTTYINTIVWTLEHMISRPGKKQCRRTTMISCISGEDIWDISNGALRVLVVLPYHTPKICVKLHRARNNVTNLGSWSTHWNLQCVPRRRDDGIRGSDLSQLNRCFSIRNLDCRLELYQEQWVQCHP